VRLLTAGNQSGKTHCGAVEAAHYALGSHPYRTVRVPNRGYIVSAASMKEGIEEIIVPKIRSVVGSNDIKNIKNSSQGMPSKIIWRSGSVTNLMSAEQDDGVFEGKVVDWAWMDEPQRKNIFIGLKRGMLTTGGHLWMTCTPLDEPWIYEDIYIPGKEGNDPDIMVFEGSSDENRFILEENKEEFKKHLTEDELQARWYGKFRHLAGRVIKSYDPAKHRIPSFNIPTHWPVWMSIDPHRGKPHAVLFLTVSPDGIKYICNEIFVNCSIEQLAQHILDVSSQYNIVKRVIDTSAQEAGWEKESAREILERCGVRGLILAQKKNLKNSGIIMINQGFSSDQLFVMEHCVRTHRELQNYIYKKNKRDHQIVIEEPEKKFDDMMDCLRYTLVERPKYRTARVKQVGPIYVRGVR